MLSFRIAGIYICFTNDLNKHFKFWSYWSVFQCHLTVYPLSGLASAWDEHNALPALFVLLTRFTCCNVERGDLDCSSLQTNSPKLMNVNAAHEQNKSGKRRMALKTEVNRWNLCSVHPNTRLSALVSKCSKSALELKLPNTCLYYMKEDSESTWWGGSQSSDWCWLPKHRLHMPSIKMVIGVISHRAICQHRPYCHPNSHTLPFLMYALKYAGLYQTLPNPQTLLAIEWVCELSHPVRNCESWRLSFQHSIWSWDAKIIIGQSVDPSFSLSSPIGTLNCITYSI